MSRIDGTDPNEVNPVETNELPPNPETAKTPEEFQDRLEANRKHITDGMRSDDDWNERASQLADSFSPEELQEKIDGVGDQSELARKYEEAVLGSHDGDAIEETGTAWADAVKKNEVYNMALERFDTGEDENDESTTVEQTGKGEVDDGPPDLAADPTIESENDDERTIIEIGKDGQIVDNRFEGLRYGIQDNKLAEVEEYRNLQKGELLAESSRDNYAVDPSGLDAIPVAFKNTVETKAGLSAIDETADKMREYIISQGHKEDYTEDFGPVK